MRLPVLAALVLALLLAPGSALARRTMTIVTKKFEIPAKTNREVCIYVPLPAKTDLDVSEIVMQHQGGKGSFASHHLILYAYTGDLAGVEGVKGQAIDDTACLEFGDRDPANLRIVATAQGPSSRQPMPRGTALKLRTVPGAGKVKNAVGLVVNSHWINGDTRPRKGRAKLKLILAKPANVKRTLQPIFEVVANGAIRVPPGKVQEVGFRWAPGTAPIGNLGTFLSGTLPPEGPACVTWLIGHMHERGTLFTADLVRQDGSRRRLYTNTRYADPPSIRFDPPLYVGVGDRIEYNCTHDNATHTRLGCEEVAGEAPGVSVTQLLIANGGFENVDGSAKICTAAGANPAECPRFDPAFPERTFTGACVPANLVFGFRSWDEMCILPGYYFDADPSAPPEQACVL
ncbi:MAG: hypothetical protein KIT14_12100 [bacterium]|nr:hypothetical protein [bacterium]